MINRHKFQHMHSQSQTVLPCFRPPHPPPAQNADSLIVRNYDKVFFVINNFTVTVKTSENSKVKHGRSLTFRGVFLNSILMAFPSHFTAKPAALCPLDIRECPGIGCHGNGCYGLWIQGQCCQTLKKTNKTKAINSLNVRFVLFSSTNV